MDSVFTMTPHAAPSSGQDHNASSVPLSMETQEVTCDENDLIGSILDSLAAGHPIELDDQTRYLLKSFDMIFQLQQHSEEMRYLLERIDGVVLTSRSPAHLTTHIVTALEQEFDEAAVKILFRPDHPVASAFLWEAPSGVGIIPQDLLDSEILFPEEPFVLDDPAGELAQSLFGKDALSLSSAAVANLCCEGEELGLLCLGSQDPDRFWGGMYTDLIAALARKVALGILNACAHERRVREAIIGTVDGLYTEAFFLEVLQKEFHRSWRTHVPFSLMALSWHTDSPDSRGILDEVASLITRNMRSADFVAAGDSAILWILLPHTDPEEAHVAAERLCGLAAETFGAGLDLRIGITAFSSGASVATVLLDEARNALDQAMADDAPSIVVRSLEELEE